MSISLMTHVWTLDVAATPKLVLLALADNANDDGVCYPSITALCQKTSLSARAIFHHLKQLEQAGYLHRENRTGRSTLYHLHPCTTRTPAPRVPLHPMHPCTTCILPLHLMHPTPARRAPYPCTSCTSPLHLVHPPLHLMHP